MSIRSTGSRSSFIVRIWQEPGSPSGWRGQVNQVGSQETSYFEELGSLMLFLERHLQRMRMTSGPPPREP